MEHLEYGQHPQKGMPLGSWPKYGRAGGQREGVYHPSDAATYRLALRADEDFIELLALILPKIL